MSEVTLQINLSAGDVDYASLTVPRLIAAHAQVAERLAVVDCCRPQRTRIFDPDTRVPEPAFSERVQRIRNLAETFLRQGLFDRVEYLLPAAPLFHALAAKYVQSWMTATHDYGGCAFMAYWAAFDLPRTRYVIHYDADMLLHQAGNVDWAQRALTSLSTTESAIAAAPRTSPPWTDDPARDAPTRHEGRPATKVPGGWLNDWFSTRCLLLDRERLASELPLVRGYFALIQRLRKWFDRGYPPGPELVLHRILGARGRHCLHLDDTEAWLLHPTRKDAPFLSLLPAILSATQSGDVPSEQRGYADLRIEAWRDFVHMRS